MFWYYMELSMTPTCPTSQLPHFNVWWIPCGLVNTCQKGGFNNQRWKKGLVMSPTSTNTCTNTLSTSWVVISHPKFWTINWQSWNKQNGIFQLATQHSQRIPLHKWMHGPLVLASNTSMLSLHLPSSLNWVTTYCPKLRTREWYQLISTCKTNLASFTTTLVIHIGSNHTQPNLYQLFNFHITQIILSNCSSFSLNTLPISW